MKEGCTPMTTNGSGVETVPLGREEGGYERKVGMRGRWV